MDSNGGTPKRVELEGGQWADVRRVTAGIVRQLRAKTHERGYEDGTQETIDAMPMVIAAWSFSDPINAATTEARLVELDMWKVWVAAKGADPNPLTPSSDGTARRGQTRRRSNG